MDPELFRGKAGGAVIAVLLISFGLTTAVVSGGFIVSANEIEVEVGDNYFEPDVIEVDPGDTIVFEHVGNTDHTVTIEDTEYDERISPGETVTVTIEEEGVYDLNCNFHAGHDGTIYVGEEAPDDDPLPGFTVIGFAAALSLAGLVFLYRKKMTER